MFCIERICQTNDGTVLIRWVVGLLSLNYKYKYTYSHLTKKQMASMPILRWRKSIFIPSWRRGGVVHFSMERWRPMHYALWCKNVMLLIIIIPSIQCTNCVMLKLIRQFWQKLFRLTPFHLNFINYFFNFRTIRQMEKVTHDLL